MDKVYISAYTDDSFSLMHKYVPTSTNHYIHKTGDNPTGRPNMKILNSTAHGMQVEHNKRMRDVIVPQKKKELIGELNKTFNNTSFGWITDICNKLREQSAEAIRLANYAKNKSFAMSNADAQSELIIKLGREYLKIASSVNGHTSDIVNAVAATIVDARSLINKFNNTYGEYDFISDPDGFMKPQVDKSFKEIDRTYNKLLDDLDSTIGNVLNEWMPKLNIVWRSQRLKKYTK